MSNMQIIIVNDLDEHYQTYQNESSAVMVCVYYSHLAAQSLVSCKCGEHIC